MISYWKMYEYLKELLAERAAADEPVMIILDSFEKFAQETGSSKQLLLYNLLDWLQVPSLCCMTDCADAVIISSPDFFNLWNASHSPRILRWACSASVTTST